MKRQSLDRHPETHRRITRRSNCIGIEAAGTLAARLRALSIMMAVAASAWAVSFATVSRADEAEPLNRDRFVNGSEVRAAFRPTVATARESTVRVQCDGRNAAFGAIVRADGWIVTKASELTGDVTCLLTDGRRLTAKTAAVDRDLDVALLKVEADDLPAVVWHASGHMHPGRWVATAGPAETPAAVGVVSVAQREIPRRSGVLGIDIENDALGPRIRQVYANSGAAMAGLKPNDVVTHVRDRRVETADALRAALREFHIGDLIDITFRRGEDERRASVTLRTQEQIFMTQSNAEMRVDGRVSQRRDDFKAAIQHDSILPPTSCGGPLVDLDGNVIGLNIARVERIATYALPSETVEAVIEALLPRDTLAGNETHQQPVATEAGR